MSRSQRRTQPPLRFYLLLQCCRAMHNVRRCGIPVLRSAEWARVVPSRRGLGGLFSPHPPLPTTAATLTTSNPALNNFPSFYHRRNPIHHRVVLRRRPPYPSHLPSKRRLRIFHSHYPRFSTDSTRKPARDIHTHTWMPRLRWEADTVENLRESIILHPLLRSRMVWDSTVREHGCVGCWL